MTFPEFDVALEVSKLKSPPAKTANPANLGGKLATLATLAGGVPHLDAIEPQKNFSSFSHFSRGAPQNGRGTAAPASTIPAPEGTGLEWVTYPPTLDADKYGGQWAAFDLADLGKLYGVRVVRAGERILAVYQPSMEAELVAYAGSLLAEARGYLRQHMDKLPLLAPAEAVSAIKEIMRQHRGLRFCRGEDGSRWPIYPKTWTAGQKVVVQSLWFIAGPTLDQDNFEEIDR